MQSPKLKSGMLFIEIAKKRKMGIVVVTHESKLMQRLCQRVIDFNDFS